MSQIQELAHLQIPLQTIKLATNNFSLENLVGIGGFGKVYKGMLPPPSNKVVAVKRLDIKHGQGQTEFLKEILVLARCKHDNIVSLLGFCDEDGEKVLVYNHEVNGSLDSHLADPDLTWEQRLQICLDAARGLKYLHDDVGVGHRVIHRDIKSSNILLDENWKAKISDFGFCKIGTANEQFSFLVSDVGGTMGYIDPQYMETGVQTKESDIYAFGVVLCEVLCGRLACIRGYDNERTFLYLLVRRHYKERNLEKILFCNPRGPIKPYSLETFSRIAYKCTNEDRKHRPTMEVVVKELEAAIEHQTSLEEHIALEHQVALKVIVAKTKLWGAPMGGRAWSFMVKNNEKLRSITVNRSLWIKSIAFTKKDLDGTLHSSETYGGASDTGEIFETILDDGEEITGLSVTIGTYGGLMVVSSLCFMTNKRKYGPFGRETDISFSDSWDVGLFAGFYGRCGTELDAIGGCFMTIV